MGRLRILTIPWWPVFDAAAYLFGELDRLHVLKTEFFSTDTGFLGMRHPTPDFAVKRHFEDPLTFPRGAGGPAPGGPRLPKNALFATVLRMGLHSDYTGLIERHYLASVADMKQARGFAERLLMENPSNYDTYLAIGVENYISEPESAPARGSCARAARKPINRSVCRTSLMTAEKGHYLSPFAGCCVAVAALRDMDFLKALRRLGASRF